MSERKAPWHEANRAYLIAALAAVQAQLRRPRGGSMTEVAAARALMQEHADAMEVPPALLSLSQRFGLSGFEHDILVLCAGMELDASVPALCAGTGDSRRSYPTFSLCLAALENPHWSATTPTAPLRYGRLIELDPAEGMAYSRLRIDERILHHLAGVSWLDTRLHGLVRPLPANPPLIADAHSAIAARIARIWKESQAGCPPVIQLSGPDPRVKEVIAQAVCGELGLCLYVARAADLPGAAIEREALARLWRREAALAPTVLLIHADDDDSPQTLRHLVTLAEDLDGMVVLAAREPLVTQRRATLRIDVVLPSAAEQERMWKRVVSDTGAAPANGEISRLVAHFNLSTTSILAAGVELAEQLRAGGDSDVATGLWRACKAQARPRLDDLAQRIAPRAAWEDIVLPEQQANLLRSISAHVRQRATVYEKWGFAAKGARGLGISVLFAGASGTGKTMAAEVLAAELDLDLYRIDLSQVVSKYIGETEKNLRRIFDAAEEGGAVLLFDEADALFGKRSEVKDSHDRYANLEVSYLLQRMEAYRGLAILTTNMRAALDTAFLRRLRYIVEFPFPGPAERRAIWGRVFPDATPTEGLALDRLARLNITGGVIRNIALNAAFLAADSDQPVGMAHLRRAAEIEFLKLERPLSDGEIRGWV